VRVDLGKGEVPERKAKAAREAPLGAPDLAERPPRVRAFVVAVLDEKRSVLAAADVVDRRVELLEGRGLLDHREVIGATEDGQLGTSSQWRRRTYR
jgi:hypothetical protein